MLPVGVCAGSVPLIPLLALSVLTEVLLTSLLNYWVWNDVQLTPEKALVSNEAAFLREKEGWCA